MIEVEHLSKSYGSIAAVRDLSFHVHKGTVVGFLGPNGAGKSTTLRILAGFLGASDGRVRIAGFDIAERRLDASRHIGYMPETSPLYPEMKVREYLAFRAELKRVARAKRKVEVARALELARVADMAQMLIGHLSKGYRQRVGLADALLGSPPLLILDEPTAGLDPNQIREVRSLIAELGESHTVLLSTHILSEVEASCSRAIVIAKGRLVADGSIDEIRRAPERAGYRDGAFGRPRLELVLRGSAEKASRAIGKIDGVADVAVEERSDDVVHATVALSAKDEAGAATVIEQIVAALVKAKVAVRSVVPQAASLEQVFAQLTEERPHHDGGTEVAGAAGAQQQAATTELNGQADEAEEDA